MDNLIKISVNEEQEQVVSGRELHEFLEVGTQYTKWFERKVEKYGFIENSDFATISQNRLTAQGNETTCESLKSNGYLPLIEMEED